MRHLWSLLGGLAAAPVIWILVALGQDGSSGVVTGWADSGAFNTARLIEPAVYLGAAGIVLGLVATIRTSPLGATLAGLLLLTPYVGMFIAPLRVRDLVPDTWRLFGDPLRLHVPLDNGTLALLGMMLLIAVFSAQRWRRWVVPPHLRAGAAAAPVAGAGGRTLDDTDPDLFAGGVPAVDPDPDTKEPTLAYPPLDPPDSQSGPSGSPWAQPPGLYRSESGGKAE